MKKIAVLLVMLASGLGCLFVGVREFREALASLSWPSVPGVIERSQAHAFEGCVRFSYTVAGQTHTATTVLFHEEGITTNNRSLSCSDDVVQRYPAGKEVEVRYNPANAAYAILEPGPTLITLIFPGLGLLLTSLGGWLLWTEGATRIRVRRATPALRAIAVPAQAAGTPAAGNLVGSNLITPSEVVAIHGSQFAPETLAGNIRLLNGDAEVSARELLLAELKAAILAHEQAGTIRLEISDTPKRRLYLVPMQARFAWPNPSMEARLEFPVREEASAVVRRWLAQPSHVGWARGAEKVHVALVLRRAAVVSQTGMKRRYTLADRNTEAAATQNLPAVRNLLQRCESERSEVWHLLTVAIEGAVEVSAERSWDVTFSRHAAADPGTTRPSPTRRRCPG